MKQISKCCQAKVKVVGDDEGTNFYQCQACKQGCDILAEEKECHHQFWKDGNPPQCFNCGKTKEEIYEAKVKEKLCTKD